MLVISRVSNPQVENHLHRLADNLKIKLCFPGIEDVRVLASEENQTFVSVTALSDDPLSKQCFIQRKNSGREDPGSAQSVPTKRVLIFIIITYHAHVAKMDRCVVRRPCAAVEELTSQTTYQLSTDSVATAEQPPSSDSLEPVEALGMCCLFSSCRLLFQNLQTATMMICKKLLVASLQTALLMQVFQTLLL